MSYLDNTNPNLIATLHFLSKSLWLILAAFFGFIGLQLYSLGVTTTGDATASFFGVEISLNNAGPGLIVMVIALFCSLIGAIKAKVVMTEDTIELAAHSPNNIDDKLGTPSVIPIEESFFGVKLPGGLEILESVWGLTEVAMIRMPISIWASSKEINAIERIHGKSWGQVFDL